MKPRPDHISRVQDAITILKGKGDPHYRTDIAAYTGLTTGQVNRVLDHLEAKAKANPTGRVTIPWSEMRGKKGGIATSAAERWRAHDQRRQSMQSQLIRDAERCEAEFRRNPIETKWATEWAISAKGIDDAAVFPVVREAINDLHFQALIDSGMDALPALKDHLVFMAEIDAL